MSARQKRERILRLLASAYASHRQWQQAREKALSQLQSMSNLAEQLVTLRRCTEAGRLGSVSGYPQLASLLEAKIITSFERSLSYLHKARLCVKSMLLTCPCLKFGIFPAVKR